MMLSILEDRSHWTQGALTRDKHGHDVPTYSDKACRWCLAAARGRAVRLLHAPDKSEAVAYQAVRDVVRRRYAGKGHINASHKTDVTFNDDPTTHHRDVVSLLQEVIKELSHE